MKRHVAPEMPGWLAAMLPDGIERYAVTVGAHRMHVMEMGEGRPVLLLHGNPTWSFLYREVARVLAAGAGTSPGSSPGTSRGKPAGLRLIMPDLIGLGFSDKPRDLAAHTLEAHSGWLGSLIDGLDLDGLIFVGQDWGGPIGLHALSSRADRVAGLVILNTVVGPPRPGFRPTLFHRLSRLPGLSDGLFRVAGFPQNLLQLAQGDRRSVRGPISRAYRYPLRRLRDRAAPLALARMVPDRLEHPSIAALEVCRGFVTGFQGPAAIVWGDRDPILGRLRRRTEAALPQAQVTATRAGHFLQEEVPGEIAAAIRSVATQLDG